jgi:hypothetical protein
VSRLSVATALLVSVLTIGAASADAPGPEGTFTLDKAASDDVKEAVERSAGEFNFVLRSFARSRLTKANPIPQQVRIVYTPGEVSVQLDLAPAVTAPRDGNNVKWTRDDGAMFDLTARTDGGVLRQSFEGKDGQRVNVYRLRDARTLAMEVTLTSPRLAKPLTYTLVFRRVE